MSKSRIPPVVISNATARATTTKRKMFSAKTSRANVLAMLLATVVISLASPLSSAQESPAPQKQEHTARPRQRSTAQQLAHETREAAGEEQDETDEFKNSPSVAFIARLTGLSLSHAFLFSSLLNFAVVAAIIFWAARKYLPGIFSARNAAIQKAMQQAQRASEEARRRLAEIENRLMKLDGEIGMMRDSAEKEAAAEEARIQVAAQQDARKIVEAAEQEIASAVKSARRELAAYAADLAVALAKKQIHVDAATDRALVRNFAGELAGEASPERAGKDGR
jgi:F-type H+-transporting ATPase subunit b